MYYVTPLLKNYIIKHIGNLYTTDDMQHVYSLIYCPLILYNGKVWQEEIL